MKHQARYISKHNEESGNILNKDTIKQEIQADKLDE